MTSNLKLYKAYLKFEYSQDVESPYDEQLEFIYTNNELLLKLQASNEGYWFNQPTKFYLNTKGNTLWTLANKSKC